MSDRGYNGRALEEALIEGYHIYPELNTGNILMAMTGIGNTREDYSRLLEALRELAEREKEPSSPKASSDSRNPGLEGRFAGLMAQEGKTCLRSVIPYPPGIPLICPGETITEEQLRELITCLVNGEKVLGLTKEGLIKVNEG
jgi:arginine/lysine/ornithine decarboxylase